MRSAGLGGMPVLECQTPGRSAFKSDVTVEFRPMAGATWETLMSGQFTVYLEEHPPGLVGVCTGQARPFGTVVDVRMIIEGDVPADVLPSTWGQVKSLWSN